jgi:hypothetical protein
MQNGRDSFGVQCSYTSFRTDQATPIGRTTVYEDSGTFVAFSLLLKHVSDHCSFCFAPVLAFCGDGAVGWQNVACDFVWHLSSHCVRRANSPPLLGKRLSQSCDDQQSVSLVQFLRVLFEQKDIREFFSDWKKDPVLAIAHKEASVWYSGGGKTPLGKPPRKRSLR